MKYCFCFISIAFLMVSDFACRSLKIQADTTTANSSKQVQQLLKAAKNDDRDKLHNLVASGIDIDAIEEGWGTALYQAVFVNDVNAVGLLLECGADVNKGNEDGHSPLHAATESESKEAVKIVEILISHGANVNAKVKSDIVPDSWIDISEGRTPLHNAAMVNSLNEDLEVVSNKTVVALLLAHGANVNAQDAYGSTALSDALFSQSLDVIELLIKHGADVNIKNNEDGGSILHDAAYDGWLEAVQLFVSHGANVNSRDFDSETPLYKAALGRHMDVVSFLVNHGADIHAASKRNETPQNFLDEPNDTKPILLSNDDKHTFALIVTNGLNIRMKLKSESIDYDTIWFPLKSSIEGLDRSFKNWIMQGKHKEQMVYIEPKYILEHFHQYNCEYAGFVKDNTNYIICNMVQASSDPSLQPPLMNDFSGILDGGCAQVVIVFDAHKKQVVWVRCNNM